MPAIFDRILTLNLVASTAIFYIAARIYLLPLLPRLRPKQVLLPILLLHSMRHLGMMFLTRGATYPGLSAQFAYPAAFGDGPVDRFGSTILWVLAVLGVPNRACQGRVFCSFFIYGRCL